MHFTVADAFLWLRANWIELFGFATGAACVWLLVKQSIWNWPASIANFLFFIVLFYRNGLYGDMALQFLYIPIAVYGWWNWLHGGAQHSELHIQRLTRQDAQLLAPATAAMVVVFALLLKRYTPSTVPWLDAVSTALSITAIYMQSRKWIENWWVWSVANGFYVCLYIYKDLWLTALLNVIFTVMCIVGLREWQRALAGESVQPAEATA